MTPPEPFLKWSAWVRWYADWRFAQTLCLIKGHRWDDYRCERCEAQRRTDV